MNDIYADLSAQNSSTRLNQRKLENHVIIDWLIVPKAEATEDDTDTIVWRSRNIPPQDKVHIEPPPDVNFGSWTDFRIWSNQNSVECPKYLIHKGLKNGALSRSTVSIGDDDEADKIWIAKFGQYSSETGLTFDETDTFI